MHINKDNNGLAEVYFQSKGWYKIGKREPVDFSPDTKEPRGEQIPLRNELKGEE